MLTQFKNIVKYISIKLSFLNGKLYSFSKKFLTFEKFI